MRCGDITAHLNNAAGRVTIRDHLFDIELRPREALALLHWLEENEEQLQVLERTRPEPRHSRRRESLTA
ncbi:MAG TPA: hypothetical protein DEP84_34245 [Chloroflexi bacterium]|nr:hypothetical protein [Chloroflexota bacterium]